MIVTFYPAGFAVLEADSEFQAYARWLNSFGAYADQLTRSTFNGI